MKDICRVDVLQPSQDLVHKELDMIIREGLVRLDDLGQVCLHQLTYYVYLFEIGLRLRLQYCLHSDDIIMLKQSGNFEFSERPLCEDFMFEGFLDLFNSH
jgi:hypothetical protein